MSELFVESDSVPAEPVKKPRKKREPMSAEKKLEFAARMKASREQKKLEKEQAKEQVKVVKEKVQAKQTEKVQAKQTDKVVKPKKDRVLRHVPNELDIHKHEIDCLKNELLLLKRNKTTNKKDMEEIQELKLEMKELRDAARLYKQSLKKKETPPAPPKENIKVEIKEPVKAQAKPIDIPKPKAKYSTYKKSIWAQFT